MRRIWNPTAGEAALLALALTAALGAQGPATGVQAPATVPDADFLLRAYGTYQTMARSSPYRAIPWQYLGPTNVSGRTTDIAVANRAGGRRIYAAYLWSRALRA